MAQSSSKKVSFIKMAGLGNDFVVLDDRGVHGLKSGGEQFDGLTTEQIQLLCDRDKGVGADQVIGIKNRVRVGPVSDARVEFYNADGSEAEICGNGLRAVALYLAKESKNNQGSFELDTPAGLKKAEVNLLGDQPMIGVNMGEPQLLAGFRGGRGETLTVDAKEFVFFEVNVGNPHAVIFVSNLKQHEFGHWGPRIENHSRFPEKTNVEWVEVADRQNIHVKVWERGAGLTLACGTGATAAAAACMALEKVDKKINVHLPGGVIEIQWDGPGHDIYQRGPAEEITRGEFAL